MQQTIGIILGGLTAGALWMLIGLFLGSKLGIGDYPKNLKQIIIQCIICGPAMPVILGLMYVFDKVHKMWNQTSTGMTTTTTILLTPKPNWRHGKKK